MLPEISISQISDSLEGVLEALDEVEVGSDT